MRRLKRILWKLLLLLLLGIALGVVAAYFQWEDKTLQIVIIGCCGVYLAVTLLHYFLVIHPYRRRVLQQAADMEAGRAAEALEDIQRMMEEPRVRRSKYLTNGCQINLTAAYCHLGQDQAALDQLRAIPEKQLKGDFELVYHLNTAICLFYTGSEQEGLSHYLAHRKLFHAYRKHPYYGGNLAVLQCWAMLAQGQAEEAKEVLRQAKETWTKLSLQEAYEKLERRLTDGKETL